MATAKKAAAKKTTASSSNESSSTRAEATSAADMLNPMKNLKAMTDRLQELNLTGGASKLLESGQKDLQALMQANEKSYQGLQTVVQRQTEMIKSAITEWQTAAKEMPGKDPKANLAKLDELGRQSFQRAIDDIKELANLAAKSQADAFELVRQRIQSNVDEVTKMLKRK
ncbi:phasin family protein [Variovorax paradoxus]|uniref:TIGR01841 family phasin n=1 Tax=Variovorax paradoxus TaxID=34073 RepID=UPI002792B1AF|nr:TIGR01841 family phasin [Variovorax paradoxus]MDQ0568248.1 phasin family protein [Variovorax paradoxus]